MMLDILTRLSDSQVILASATDDSTYSYDTVGNTNTGIGEPMVAAIFVEANTGTSGGTIKLYSGATEAASTTLISTYTIPAALVAGDKIVIPIPANDDDNAGQSLRTDSFYKLVYAPTGGTSIQVSSYILPASFVQNNNVYPASGYTVS